MKLGLLVMPEAKSIKSHWYSCPSMNWTRSPPIGMPKRMRQSSKASSLHKELQASKGCWGWERESFPAKSTPIGYPNPNAQAQNHTRETLYRLRRLYLGIHTHKHTYTCMSMWTLLKGKNTSLSVQKFLESSYRTLGSLFHPFSSHQ